MEGLKIDEIIAQIPDDKPDETAQPNQQAPGELKPQFSYGDEFEKTYPKK